MKFLDKYKLYRSIMKQKPVDLSFGKHFHKIALPYKSTEYVHYKTNDYNIYTGCWIDLPVSYRAIITNKYGIFVEFNHLFAKRLFNHGKKYSK